MQDPQTYAKTESSCIHMHPSAGTHINTCTCTCTYTHMYMYTHTHAHSPTCWPVLLRHTEPCSWTRMSCTVCLSLRITQEAGLAIPLSGESMLILCGGLLFTFPCPFTHTYVETNRPFFGEQLIQKLHQISCDYVLVCSLLRLCLFCESFGKE